MQIKNIALIMAAAMALTSAAPTPAGSGRGRVGGKPPKPSQAPKHSPAPKPSNPNQGTYGAATIAFGSREQARSVTVNAGETMSAEAGKFAGETRFRLANNPHGLKCFADGQAILQLAGQKFQVLKPAGSINCQPPETQKRDHDDRDGDEYEDEEENETEQDSQATDSTNDLVARARAAPRPSNPNPKPAPRPSRPTPKPAPRPSKPSPKPAPTPSEPKQKVSGNLVVNRGKKEDVLVPIKDVVISDKPLPVTSGLFIGFRGDDVARDCVACQDPDCNKVAQSAEIVITAYKCPGEAAVKAIQASF